MHQVNRAFLAELRRIVGDTGVLDDALELLTYECDALPHLRESPAAVAIPSSTAEVQAIVRLCARDGVPFVARGHGTGLSGGALPVAGGLVIAPDSFFITRSARTAPRRRGAAAPRVARGPSGYR